MENSLSIVIVAEADSVVANLREILGNLYPEAEIDRAKLISTGLKLVKTKEPDLVFIEPQIKDITPKSAIKEWFSSEPDSPVVVLVPPNLPSLHDYSLSYGALISLTLDETLEVLLPKIFKQVLSLADQKARNIRTMQGITNLFDISGTGMLLVDPESRYIRYANQKAMDMYGYTEKEFKKLKLEDLEIQDNYGYGQHWEEGQASNPHTGITRVRHWTKDKQKLFLEIEKPTFSLWDEPFETVVLHDLTDLKKQMNDIQFLQQFNSYILDQLPFGITIKTEKLRVTYQNSFAKKSFGMLVGQRAIEAIDDPIKLREIERMNVLSGGKNRGGSIDISRDNLTFSITVLKVKDFRKDVDIVVELAQDVTKQSIYQRELIRAQRLEAVGNLAGGVAHDFNNLLSGILGYANLIVAISDEDDQVVQYAEIIEETCERASELTKQLLQFSRIKSSVQETFDLNAIVRYSCKLLLHSKKKEIKLIQKVSKKKIAAHGDPAQVQQMIVNLGLNANHSMTKGDLTISTDRVEILDNSELLEQGIEPGEYGKIEVHDTGRAIDAESLQSILDPFFTHDNNSEPVDLRLSVADTIARSHGGCITLNADAETGTSFTIYIPIFKEPEKELQEEPDEPALGTETILVIDEEEVIRNLILTSLSRFGYRILVAGGAEEGLKLYSMFMNEIDIVLVDGDLPKLGELTLVELLKTSNDDVKIIMFCSSDTRKTMKSYIELGARDYVKKPINLKLLTNKIRETLSN